MFHIQDFFLNLCLYRIEPDNEYYDGEKDQDRDGPAADS